MDRSQARLLGVASVILLLTVPLAGALNPTDPWVQMAKLQDENPEAEDEFGATVAVDDDTMVVGHPLEDDESATVGFSVGAITVYDRTGGTWFEVAQFMGEEPRSRFGGSIALDADTFVTSATGQSTSGWDDGPYVQCAYSTAELYVYERVGSSWERTQTLQPSSAVPHETCLGHMRSLALDDDLLVVGDPWTSSEVYVYERQVDGEWTVVDAVACEVDCQPDLETHPFGRGVDVSAASNRVVVGHPFPDGDPAVHVYDRSGDVWTKTTTLTGCCDWTGRQLALSEDGTTLAATSTPVFEGDPVRLWERTKSGWTHIADLQPWDVNDANPWISALDFDEEGDTLAVGTWVDDIAPSVAPELRDEVPVGLGTVRTGAAPEKVASPFGNGAVYLFREASNGSWQQTAKVQQADDVGMDFFGWDAALDHGTLAVGAPGHNAPPDDAQAYTQDPKQLLVDAYADCCHGAVYTYTRSDLAGTVGPEAPGGGLP